MTFHASYGQYVCNLLYSKEEKELLKNTPTCIIEYETSCRMFCVSGEKIEWLQQTHSILGLDTSFILNGVQYGHWARAGFRCGSLRNSELDEENRTSGSAINAYFVSHIYHVCITRLRDIYMNSHEIALILHRKLYN